MRSTPKLQITNYELNNYFHLNISVLLNTVFAIKYAKTIKTASFKINGADTVKNALKIFVFDTTANHTTPKTWQRISPNAEQTTFKIGFCNFCANAQNKQRNINPIINPPLIPKRVWIPPLKPEKTGIPIKPSRIYAKTEQTPLFTPKRYPQSATAKV